jgi:YHS domain-containing protein
MKIKAIILSLAALAVSASVVPLRAEEPPKGYPLTTCVVSGEKLGEHGKIIKASDKGTDVYLCCKMCAKDFAKKPAKYTKMVKEATSLKTKS